MQPTGPIQSGLLTQFLASTEANISNWRIGQVLQATSLSNTTNGKTLLQIGNQQIDAIGSHNIKVGQQLKLLVTETGHSPLLKIISHPTSSPVQDAIRLALPRQDSIAPLIANLAQIINKKIAHIPLDVRTMIQDLLSKLPAVDQASTAKGLRKAILNNGNLLETKLSQMSSPTLQRRNQDPISSDTKANLIRLLDTLKGWAKTMPKTGVKTNTATTNTATTSTTPGSRLTASPGTSTTTTATTTTTTTTTSTSSTGINTNPSARITISTPPPPLAGTALYAQARVKPNIQQLNNLPLLQIQLEQQVESAVARIQLQQLASIPQPVERNPEWLIELPLQKNNETDLWAIGIKQEESKDSDNKQTKTNQWAINLAFNLPKLGPIHARVILNNDKISTHFLAEHKTSEKTFNQHLSKLRQQLDNAGLETSELSCQHGINKTQETISSKIDKLLIDEQV